jgi:hypothetical protein
LAVLLQTPSSAGGYWLYRVRDRNGALGWQSGKPEGYLDLPYSTLGTNPFDPEAQGDVLYWPEGEKDVDQLTKLVSLIDSFGEQLSQVFMLRVFDVDTNC